MIHDDRGTAIWDWAIAPDVLTSTSTTGLLRALDAPGQLSLEEQPEPDTNWCGDPYNRTTR